ncbi:hypothetical protein BCR32DRAFT_76520 [Anaeromyces robustus]|uniref:Transmembrane protein n=1 Tax=Anaeromyces robustus TaxID=1754192 RepID=A0A1Y1WT95_9FUNG|nr:hypothetical protein BCR32DRAFT_76520 [Anaeromyces robustus]|eukprot:ORX76466.1 hypothetical protein BCR32DRAFT_76520 [Anaeromyces robustus]
MILNKYNIIFFLLYIVTFLFLNTQAHSIKNEFSKIIIKKSNNDSKDKYKVFHSFPIGECIRCEKEDFQKEFSYCRDSGYKQLVQWSLEEVYLKNDENIEDFKLNSEDIIVSPNEKNFKESDLPKYRGCFHQKHKKDIKNFIKFQVWTLIMGIISFIITLYRKKTNLKKQYLNILRLIGK